MTNFHNNKLTLQGNPEDVKQVVNKIKSYTYENKKELWFDLEFIDDDHTIKFITNWGFPAKIVEYFSKEFPTVLFIHCVGNESEPYVLRTWEIKEGYNTKYVYEADLEGLK